jgi:hypothetical protein
MRYPTDSLVLQSAQNQYPIKCWSGFKDGFSGWYAVSNPRRCTDFCFWETSTEYTSANVADPHQTTFLSTLESTSVWRCALNVADDLDLWSNVDTKLTAPGHFGASFAHLQCSRGAGEELERPSDRLANSPPFWWFLTFAGTIAILIQLVRLSVSVVRRKRESGTAHEYDFVDEENESAERVEVSEESEFDDEYAFAIANEDTPRQARRYCRAFMLLALNIGILVVLTISIASLIDVRGQRMMSAQAMRLTPKCYSQYSECRKANVDIDRPSREWRSANNDDSGPFSYIVASDAQLDWFDGETPELGQLEIPRPCSTLDTCSACTAKVGRDTNLQMRLAMEKLINENYEATSRSRPVPKALVLNGDLTAYYHPHERSKYELVYHDIDGLEAYFPALGNHEVDHGSGGQYGLDQWVGTPYCNSIHSLGYIRSGLCGNIPKFDPGVIVRYHALSLAYSWEVGRYHFVHTHYFPAFESAGIGLGSSIAWLDRDISLAYKANLTTILFVHAAQGLNDALEKVLLGRNVKAIFAGHSHRCLMRKCIAPALVYEDEIGNLTNTAGDLSSGTSGKLLPPEFYDQCITGSTGICGGNAAAGVMSLFYLQNASTDYNLPERTLFHDPYVGPDRKFCPAPRKIAILNNTLRCKKAVYGNSEFPSRHNVGEEESDRGADEETTKERIPIFYSGSASFQTFLQVDFLWDRFVVNVMTAEDGVEGQRYGDTHSVPNAVYPYHNGEDMEEVVVVI